MEESFKKKILRIFKSGKKIGKSHVDFITALLTIPVLLSVIILNYSNLQKPKDSNQNPAPTQTKQQVIVLPQNQDNKNTSPSPNSSTCTKDIGPVSINSPKEVEKITDNPVCIIINYSDSSFCSVVWSYRINNGQWSDFSSNNPCIYNLPNGNVKFDLRIQSTVVQKETDLTRNFIYQGNIASPTPASSSATTQ